MPDHSHAPDAIAARINAPPGRGYLRDAVYGGIDGSVTTFAIVAGVAGAGLSPFIIVALGLANVLADGFSMAAGNYSGTKAELDDIKRLRAVEERHIARYPEGERQEVRAILAQKGLSGPVLEDATQAITSNREAWIKLMLEGEYGLAPVNPHPLRAALATFAAFLIAGLIPLLPFLLGLTGSLRLVGLDDGWCFFPDRSGEVRVVAGTLVALRSGNTGHRRRGSCDGLWRWHVFHLMRWP